MRVSDAERHEIADALSTHFADGRLDQEEFDERMGRAMASRTRGDLAGLLRDLPPPPGTSPAPPVEHGRHRSRAMVAALVVAFLLAASGSWTWTLAGLRPWHGPHVPIGAVLVSVAAVALLRRTRRRWRGDSREP